MPTEKQKEAFDKMAENGGIISKTMLAVGYSPMTAQDPKKLTESKGWKELMEEYLPDRLLGEKHLELLMVPKKVRKFVKGELMDEYEELDSNAISKGLDMAYKLKGSYAAEKKDINANLKVTMADVIKRRTESNRRLRPVTGQVISDERALPDKKQEQTISPIPKEQSTTALPQPQVVEKYNSEESATGIYNGGKY